MSDHQANVDVKMGSERNFGIVFAFVFAVIGLWPLVGGGTPRPVFLAAALVMLGLGFLAPRWLETPNRLWFRFGMLLGAIVAPIIMFLVFVTTFLPIGLIMRALGKDPLKRRPDRSAKSYWIERTEDPQPMKNQF